MATLVFRAPPNGSLEQLQIGPADIVATVASAHAAWGWIGGLTGISSLLRYCRNVKEEQKRKRLFKALEPTLAACQILTQAGIETVPLSEQGSFGDMETTRLIGLTMCALEHNITSDRAIVFFMQFFSPPLFGKGLSQYPGSKETLHAFLVENARKIVNEGATYRFPERFDDAIAKFGLLKSQKQAKRNPESRSFGDVDLLRGFLRWLLDEIEESYYTRSAFVVRVAVCLQCVGYNVQEIHFWDGTGAPPRFRRGLILVMGGTFETDKLTEPTGYKGNGQAYDLITHYRIDTVGAMMWNSFPAGCKLHVETIQQHFEEVNDKISTTLRFRWAFSNTEKEEIQAFPVWGTDFPPATSTAIRLATVLFPESVEKIAWFYQDLARQERYIDVARQFKKDRSIFEADESRERFMTITASICISVLMQLGDGYGEVQHSTLLDLTSKRNLTWLCGEIDAILCGGCEYSRVVTVLAFLHCATEMPPSLSDPENYGMVCLPDAHPDDNSTCIVGWRRGRYAILPNLLFSLNNPLEPSVMNLRCADKFIANIPTQKNGSVRCLKGIPGAFMTSPKLLMEALERRDLENQSLAGAGTHPVFLGAPRLGSADKPLYINIERPALDSFDATLCLRARVDGESVGLAAVQQILKCLAVSWNNGDEILCPDSHSNLGGKEAKGIDPSRVFNVPASTFACSEYAPQCRGTQQEKYHVYVPVAGNTPWTVFLAGQKVEMTRIAFGCPQCALLSGQNFFSSLDNGLMMIIGYE